MLFTAAIIWGLSSVVEADEVTDRLVQYLPAEMNTLYVLHLDRILASPKGAEEDWAAQMDRAVAAGTADLPSWIQTLVVGSLTHPTVPEEVWAAGATVRPAAVTFESLAEHFQTSVDTLSGTPIVQTDRGSYLVDFPENVLGFYRPAHRQELAGWLRQQKNESRPSMSGYLHQSLSGSGDLVMSLDLSDMLDPTLIRSRLQQDPRFASQRQLVERLVPLLASLRGITLQATVGTSTRCEIAIDFGAEAGASASIVKTLFLAILEDHGAMIEEFPQTRIRPAGQTIFLSCELSDDSLRRLISLVIPPRTPHAGPESLLPTPPQPPEVATTTPARTDETAAQAQQQAVLRANRRYAMSVSRMIDDLNRASQNARSYQQTVAWHESFAGRILSLSTNNVSPELIEIGQRTASRFRALASSLRGQGINVNAQNQAITFNVTHIDPGWAAANYWGGFGYRPPSMHVESNVIQVREQQAAAVAAGELDRAQIWDMIRADQQALLAALGGR